MGVALDCRQPKSAAYQLLNMKKSKSLKSEIEFNKWLKKTRAINTRVRTNQIIRCYMGSARNVKEKPVKSFGVGDMLILPGKYKICCLQFGLYPRLSLVILALDRYSDGENQRSSSVFKCFEISILALVEGNVVCVTAVSAEG